MTQKDSAEKAVREIRVEPVSVYKSMKSTQISALRKAGLAVDDIVEQVPVGQPGHDGAIDSEQDRRRDKVVNLLASLVDDAKS
jgi:hypothetical protein